MSAGGRRHSCNWQRKLRVDVVPFADASIIGKRSATSGGFGGTSQALKTASMANSSAGRMDTEMSEHDDVVEQPSFEGE